MEGYNLIMNNLCNISSKDAKTYERSITRKFPLNLQRTGVYQTIIRALDKRQLPQKLEIGLQRKNRSATLTLLIELAQKEIEAKRTEFASQKPQFSAIKCSLNRKHITTYIQKQNPTFTEEDNSAFYRFPSRYKIIEVDSNFQSNKTTQKLKIPNNSHF